jgi:hypothetical protein
MQYQEYKKAASKHLKSCQAIVDYFDHSNHNISPLGEQYLLMNLFYLSGYTLECVINYALFNKICTKNRFPKTTCVYNLYDTSEKFGFYNKKYTDRTTGREFSAKFYIAGHDFMKNRILLKKLTPSSNLPLIHDEKIVPSSVFDLIKNWKTSCRYKTTPIYNRSDICDLIDFTDKFYREVFKVVR